MESQTKRRLAFTAAGSALIPLALWTEGVLNTPGLTGQWVAAVGAGGVAGLGLAYITEIPGHASPPDNSHS